MESSKGTRTKYVDLIEKLTKVSGYSVEKKDESTAIVDFVTDEDRHQSVLISYAGKDMHGNSILTITSTAITLPKGERLSEKKADYLLRENAKLAHGAWAIQEGDDGDLLVMSDTQIAETLESEELIASILSVAALSDALENKMTGEDVY